MKPETDVKTYNTKRSKNTKIINEELSMDADKKPVTGKEKYTANNSPDDL